MRRWWRLWWDGDALCTFYRSNDGYVAIKGWQKKVFSFVEIRLKSEHAKTWRLLVILDAIWKGNRVWIYSFDRKLSALSNAVSSKVVRLIGRELFDLKARGDIFFESPCIIDRLYDKNAVSFLQVVENRLMRLKARLHFCSVLRVVFRYGCHISSYLLPGLRSRSRSQSRSRSESAILTGVGVGVGVDEIMPTPTPSGVCWREDGVCIWQVIFCWMPAPMTVSSDAQISSGNRSGVFGFFTSFLPYATRTKFNSNVHLCTYIFKEFQ